MAGGLEVADSRIAPEVSANLVCSESPLGRFGPRVSVLVFAQLSVAKRRATPSFSDKCSGSDFVDIQFPLSAFKLRAQCVAPVED